MGFIIGLLTFVLIVDCLLLVLLVLVQLPKKEAGAGLAFGGGASDALFGAGSGNVLTKVTKYVATVFFVLAVFLSLLQSRYYKGSSNILNRLANPPAASPLLPSTAPATTPAGNAPISPVLPPIQTTPAEATNMPAPPLAVPLTNPPVTTNAAPPSK
jgi:preprotein translocase subunit SecG